MLIPETDYTKERGSVIIRLRPAYLETRSVGKHTLKANFTDGGSVETTFTIAPASVKAESLPYVDRRQQQTVAADWPGNQQHGSCVRLR